jgi:hypothetical protein
MLATLGARNIKLLVVKWCINYDILKMKIINKITYDFFGNILKNAEFGN